jgi:large subunit ribosomal protein L5
MSKKATASNMARLHQEYVERIHPALMKELGIENVFAVPRVVKIVLNTSPGKRAVVDRKAVENAANEMALIAGQKPVVTTAKKSIAQFKVREDMALGCKVTLRGKRMYEFLDRLINIALPRQRDFRGLNGRSFDGRGNYALGIKEQIIFPEIEYDKIDAVRGMDIVVCTTAKDDKQAYALLKEFNFPFRTAGR